MPNPARALAVLLLTMGWLPAGRAQSPADLRLVPWPKHVEQQPGSFVLSRPLRLEAPDKSGPLLESLVGQEMQAAGLAAPKRVPNAAAGEFFRLVPAGAKPAAEPPQLSLRSGATQEDYALVIRPDEIVCASPGRVGLVYGLQTLRQLIRANRRGGSLECLTIRDWPSLRWRAFQDDMTRGPSPLMGTLEFEAGLGAYLKFNLMTYYMEHQFAFKKHPEIGPKDGSLLPEELSALVEFAKPLGMDVLGNQQSFGHFGAILKHPRYAALQEVPDVLCPVKEGTYELLNDMYAEVCPLLPLEFFNVCCDETWGLGTGPSKALAEKIGEGGVYVRHIRRVHDLLQQKHHKRMMMWGDIILQHPKNLTEIPKDTIMLTWGYDPRPSFEDQIVPFAKSGYEFFVCPGVSNWSRILPDFAVATTNIRNFVRDGVKHGALGMINTDWKDDGESHRATKWHADAWAAECAWNASKTTPEAFNRRVGGVLFGEKGDRFGRAIEELAKTHRMAGMQGMVNGRFWESDFLPRRSPATIRTSAERLLAAVRPAIEHLEACRKEAKANRVVLDQILFGARRMERIGQRMLDGLEAARLYTLAYDGPAGQALPLLDHVEKLVRTNRTVHEALGQEFAAMWRAESKPYALEWTTRRYAAAVKGYDELLTRLADARKAAAAGKPLPRPELLGLAIPDAFGRRTRPHQVDPSPLEPAVAWADPGATHRLGLVVRAGSADRVDLPVEVEVAVPDRVAARPLRAFVLRPSGPAGRVEEVLAQLDPSDQPGRRRLVLVLPGPLPKGSQANVHVYLGLPNKPQPLAQAASTKDAPKGMKWIENDKVRLLLGPEGGHVYRWEVKALAGRDLTEPGETDWAGFCDLAMDFRTAPNKLACLARGPALVRWQASDPSGMVKTISLYGGTSWIEVLLNEPVGHYWDFDNPKNFAADGPTPGTYLFSNGQTGPVGRQADGVPAQVKVPNVSWCVKFNKEKLAVGLATPEVAAYHHLAPGSGAGGVGIEQSPLVNHFVTFAGVLESPPGETMARLSRTLDLRNPPEIVLHAVQARE